MSGIHGLWRFDGRDVAHRNLEGQARALAHRGRDRAELWTDGYVGLGHLLNRATHEDAYDRQPLTRAGVTLVADLRLDNREELAAELGIGAIEHLPDSALLLEAYLRFGEDCARRLLGDFAFAIWDGKARKLVLGRDHVGQRHVFYHQAAGFFAFASEPRGLWALPDVPRRLSLPTVGARMLLGQRPGDGATQFEEILAVEGGTLLVISPDGSRRSQRYWTPEAAPEHLNRDEAYYIATYRRVLGEAVACRVRRTSRLPGLLLGGGFDSGSIAALAGPALGASNRKLIAVSSVMPEGDTTTPRNARRWVSYLARDLPHLDVRYITREGVDIFTNLGSDLLQTDGVRGPDRFAVHLLMSELAASGVRVVMDGQGGDYTINMRARRALLRLLRRGRIGDFLAEYRAYRRTARVGRMRFFVREIALPLLPGWIRAPFSRLRNGFAPFRPTVPLAPAFLDELAAVGVQPREPIPPGELADRPEAIAKVFSRLQTSPTVGSALHAASHGMELTLPFHDKRVIEFALAIPDRFVLKDGRDRYLARKALADILPKEHLRRGNINDEMVPDFCAMTARVEPRILADIERMEKEGRMARYFDLPRIRRMLSGRETPFGKKRAQAAVERAVRSYIHARYIEWFEAANSSSSDQD